MLKVLVGVPGCGKSTFAEKLSGTVVSSDAIRAEYWAETDQTHNQEVFDIMKKRVSELLDDGKEVIVDATNILPEWRKWCIDMAFRKGVNVVAYTFENVDVNVCIERNKQRARRVPEDVIYRMADNLIPPTLDEGFDEVFIVKGGAK